MAEGQALTLSVQDTNRRPVSLQVPEQRLRGSASKNQIIRSGETKLDGLKFTWLWQSCGRAVAEH